MAITEMTGGATPLIQSTGGYGDGFGWGSSGLLGIILIIALLGGGFGGFGWGRNNGAGVAAVDSAIFASQQFNQLDNGIRGLGNGICSSTYDLNNSIKDGFYSTARDIDRVNTNLGNALCTTTYELANRINGVGTQLQQCCCDLKQGQMETNFLNERNTNAVIQNATANTQRILDYLSSKELADKNQQIFDMSQRAQTAEIIAAMKPREAIPAYLQPSPYETYRVYPTCGYNSNGCNGCNTAFI